jgi:putative transposase
MSMRDIQELLFERGVVVSYETIRRCWCDKFGAGFAHRVKAARRKLGTTRHLDEMFVTLRGEPYQLPSYPAAIAEIPELVHVKRVFVKSPRA